MKKETLIRLLCILLALCTVFAIGCTKNPPADETPSDNPEDKPGDQPGDKPQNPPEDGPTDIPEEKTGKPTDLRINLLSAPFGVDKNDLRFSWVMNDEDQNEVQKAYRITVAETAAALAAGEFVHDSGWVESSSNAAILQSALANKLSDNELYYWQVTLRDASGAEATSDPQAFTTAVENGPLLRGHGPESRAAATTISRPIGPTTRWTLSL